MSGAFTVASWNIFHGLGCRGDRVDLDATLATLRALDADLVALQEVDRGQPRSGRVDQARALGEALGMRWQFAPTLHGTPDAPAGGGAFGIALLSRLPLDQVETVALPRGRDEPRVALVARVATGGGPVTVAGTHLSYVRGVNVRQLRALQGHLAGRPAPRLLLGDLNLWPLWVRAVSLPGWRPLVRGRTWPNRPWRPRVQLDHVLLHPPGSLRALRHLVQAGPASDHRAVLAELTWP